MPSIAEIARQLGVDELSVLFEVRNLGQPRGVAEVPEDIVPTLRHVLGIGPAVSTLTASQSVEAEVSPRRRLVRRICEKLSGQGKWSPNGMLAVTIGRGFADAGEVRDALEVMRKAGWVVIAAERRGYGDTLYALNPEFRPAVVSLVEDPAFALPSDLAEWVEQSGR